MTLDRPSGAASQQRQGKGRIPQSEWPAIVGRHQEGETISAIARDYGVTGPAIRYILKKAEAAGVGPGQGDRQQAEAADKAEAAEAAAAAPEADEPEAAEPAGDDAEATAPADGADGEAAADKPRAPAGGAPRSELAQRLAAAAAACAGEVDGILEDGADPESAKDSIHEVRRALAAIEIALGRRPRRPEAAQASREAEDEIEAQPDDDGTVVGKVKFFNPDKGFGFVKPDDGGRDIFVSLQAVERSGHRTLQPDQRVKVTTTRGQKGLQADTITLLSA